jgi:hypothetical protein
VNAAHRNRRVPFAILSTSLDVARAVDDAIIVKLRIGENKKFTLFNVVIAALREVSGRYLDRRITDGSTPQGSFLYT